MLEGNRTVDPRKVDKSNDIEIQINATFNDAYRILRLWKERETQRERFRNEPSKEVSEGWGRRTTFAVFESIDSTSGPPWNFFTNTDPTALQLSAVLLTIGMVEKFGRLGYDDVSGRPIFAYVTAYVTANFRKVGFNPKLLQSAGLSSE